MKFRIVILTVLILALAGLGFMFYQNMQKLDYLEKQAKQQEFEKKQDAQTAEIQLLRSEIQNLKGGVQTGSPGAGMVQNSMQDNQPGSSSYAPKTDREAALEEQLALERQKNEVLSQESKLILRNEQGKRDEKIRMANEVDNARVVGKIQFYDKDNNILIFAPLGQPSLVAGQELAIKRKSSIFAYIKVEALDQESGSYTGEVILDDYFSIENDQDPLSQGEEIIIPPASMSRKLPALDASQQPGPAKATPPAREQAREVTPWQEI